MIEAAWNRLGEQMRVHQPDGLTLAKIEEARRVLGMEDNSNKGENIRAGVEYEPNNRTGD